MDLKDKLIKIDYDIQKGLKFKAADRLRNLINQYPNEIQLWNKLAELYYESGFLDAAGKYWILSEPNTQRIKKCVAIYEASVKYSGTKILQDITFRGDKSKLNYYALKKIKELEIDSKNKSDYIPEFSQKLNIQKKKTQEPQRTVIDKIFEKLIMLFIISIPILAIIGLIKVYEWI